MKHLIFSLVLLFLFSCSVQKRHYRKGFYVVNSHSKTEQASKPLVRKELKNTLTKFETAATLADLPEIKLVPTKEVKIIPTDSCDVLVFRDGSEIIAKITEISETQVRYKRCDNIDGPTYVTNKDDLFMLKYSNGTKETMKAPAPKTTVINPAPVKNNSTLNQQQKKYDEPASANYALISGITALLSTLFVALLPYLLITSFFGAIKAISAAKKYFSITSKEPYLYPGRAKAIAGMILGIITLAIWLVIVLVFILVLFTI